MDAAVFTYLNALPAHTPAVGRLAVPVAQDAIFLYALLLLWLWLRAGTSRLVPADSPRANMISKPRARVAEGGWRILLLAVFGAVLSLAVNAVLNVVVPRPRPFLAFPAHVLVPPPHDSSFPSDHAAVTAAIGVALILGGQTGWGAAAVLGALIIGTARVMVGIHYPSDIAGGILVGAACATAVIGAGRPLQPLVNFLIALARRLRLG